MDRRALISARTGRWLGFVAHGLAIAWTLLMLFVFWSPSPVQEAAPEWADEAVHGGSFFGFTIAWGLARVRPRWIAASGVALAIVTELVQPLLPWPRTAELGDVVADACGVALGLLLVGWRIRGRA
jgi:hypothetical protein